MFGHVVGMPLNTQLFNLLDAGRPIGSEDKTEELGHNIIEQITVTGIFELFTITTGKILIVYTAYPDLTPPRLLVLVTTRAFIS